MQKYSVEIFNNVTHVTFEFVSYSWVDFSCAFFDVIVHVMEFYIVLPISALSLKEKLTLWDKRIMRVGCAINFSKISNPDFHDDLQKQKPWPWNSDPEIPTLKP